MTHRDTHHIVGAVDFGLCKAVAFGTHDDGKARLG